MSLRTKLKSLSLTLVWTSFLPWRSMTQTYIWQSGDLGAFLLEAISNNVSNRPSAAAPQPGLWPDRSVAGPLLTYICVMQKYRVMIHGKNLLTETDGVRQKFGFFTKVFVEAFSPADAESRAVEIVREDAGLADILLNSDHDPLSLSAEEIHEVESFEGHQLPRDAFMLYPAAGA